MSVKSPQVIYLPCMTEKKTDRVTAALPPHLSEALDNMRREEPSLPSRSGMVALLIERAYRAHLEETAHNREEAA